MSYLKIALQAMKAATLDGEVGTSGPEFAGQVLTLSTPAESPQASGKPISICPQCQGEIFLRTSLGKKYCYHCITEMNGEIGIPSTGLDEVDSVLEEAVFNAKERSAIMEYDGGLDRKQADEYARVMHIQPAIKELARRGLITIEGMSPERR
jgi:hypothetical protein